MRKLHLLSNAHLDPAWLWRRNEGIAEALSTFRVAADFCESYDGFVFNHNEALLYEWVEEHEPELFARIQKLVKEKKWVIMGGWYLQPDCVMTSGESLLSQIDLGQEYFREKFGVVPTTAINFDPFGHSRGLVQILKLTGYDSYLFMRPEKLIRGDFMWEGFDGSRIKAHRLLGGYNTMKGKALNRVKGIIANGPNDVGLCLWGVGNHGGGPSRIDLESIEAFRKETDVEILHSTAEAYMADMDTENLPVVTTSLGPSMVGCYTSMVRIKQANRHLENRLAVAEKFMSYARMWHGTQFDTDELKKAKKALAYCQFHDILPGTGIKPVEEDSLRTFGYGEEIADKYINKAFIRMCEGQVKAAEGEIPIMAFNPHPYPIEGEFEVEFTLQNQNWNDGEHTMAQVFDADRNPLPTQNEEPHSNLNLDWIKRISFRGVLAPSAITRFDCVLTVKHEDELEKFSYDPENICFENDRMKVVISRKTGLIASYAVDGKQLLTNSGVLEVYNDSEDSWGDTDTDSFPERLGSFALMPDAEANSLTGYPDENCPNVRVVEDGDVRMKVQAFFKYGRSNAVVEYTIPKQGIYVDVAIRTIFQEPNKMLKYRLDTAFAGQPWGETAFGCETQKTDGQESVFHKWCGIRAGEQQLYVLNKGTYGGCFAEDAVLLTLQRTPVYSCMPIRNRPIVPYDRWIDHMDMGERNFAFRITAEPNVTRCAQVYNEEPVLLSFFPSGAGKPSGTAVTVEDPAIVLSSLRPYGNGYQATLYNTADKGVDTQINLKVAGKCVALHFGKHELKRMIF